MDIPKVKTATEAQQKAVTATVAMAFSSDPFLRWILPDAAQYLDVFPDFLKVIGGAASLRDGATFITEANEGASIWLKPGVHGEEAEIQKWVAEHVREEILPDLVQIGQKNDAYRAECEPCWYLSFLAVDPNHQRKGIGSIQLKHVLKMLDEQAIPAYLESSNSENVSLYERHGFEVMDEVQFGSSPIIRPMYRAPA